MDKDKEPELYDKTVETVKKVGGKIVQDGTFTKITAPSDRRVSIRAEFVLNGEYRETEILLDPGETVKYTNNKDLRLGIRIDDTSSIEII